MLIKMIKQVTILLLLVIFISSCEDAPEGIQGALFDDESSQLAQLSVSFSRTYDSNSNGVVNWDEVVGYDVYVTNTLPSIINGVVIEITGVSQSSYISEYSTDTKQIPFIISSGTKKSDNYWCFDCNTVSEVYIGNFYIVTESNSGSASLTVTYAITFNYEGEEYTQTFNQSVSIF